jgi:hypothetical protein
MNEQPKITRYRVKWAPTDPTSKIADAGPGLRVNHMTTTVKIIEGYTTEADIPQIIAVNRTGRISDMRYVNIISAEIIEGDE